MIYRKIRVTESDKKYLADFASLIAQVADGRPTNDPTIFEVPESFFHVQGPTPLDYHGVEEVDSEQDQNFAAAKAWLEAYTGDFEFYLSLKQQLATKGHLSDKQIDCVLRAIDRDATRAALKAQAPARSEGKAKTYSILPGTIIVVGKWKAREIAQKAGYPRAHHTLEVLEVKAETEKAYLLKVKLSAQRTSICAVCGLALTNPESVRDGIGPICAQKSELPSGDLAGLAQAMGLMNLVEVETWIPKAAIKERKDPTLPGR